MSKIVDIEKYRKKEDIQLDGEEVMNVLRYFFKIHFQIIEVTDAAGFIGYSASFCRLGEISDDEEEGNKTSEAAAQMWNAIYKKRIFADVASLIIVFMDIYMEQDELPQG